MEKLMWSRGKVLYGNAHFSMSYAVSLLPFNCSFPSSTIIKPLELSDAEKKPHQFRQNALSQVCGSNPENLQKYKKNFQ
jgi:hypothetical protein